MIKQGENLFMKNYEFPCVRAWGESPVHVSTHLKNHFSFKNKYSITSTGLIGHRYSLTTTLNVISGNKLWEYYSKQRNWEMQVRHPLQQKVIRFFQDYSG